MFEVMSICPERGHSNLPAKGRALKCQGIMGSPPNVWRQLDTFEGSESAFACMCTENIEEANLRPLKTVMNWDAAACVGGKNSLRTPACSTCGPLGSILPTTETLHLM